MKHGYWYRCTVCGYRYTPQQIQALIQLLASRSGSPIPPADGPEELPCRRKGCPGKLQPTDDPYRDPNR